MIDITRATSIKGWMTNQELRWLAEQAAQARLILEVGSYHGRSARVMADNTNGLLYCIDPWVEIFYRDDGSVAWTDYESQKEFYKNLEDHIITYKVIPFKGVLKEFESPFKFDLIFIDGDHSYESVKSDIEVAKNLISSGGIISGHDYIYPSWPGVKQAVDEQFQIDGVVGSIWHKKF